jgi:hypothetical protein
MTTDRPAERNTTSGDEAHPAVSQKYATVANASRVPISPARHPQDLFNLESFSVIRWSSTSSKSHTLTTASAGSSRRSPCSFANRSAADTVKAILNSEEPSAVISLHHKVRRSSRSEHPPRPQCPFE